MDSLLSYVQCDLPPSCVSYDISSSYVKYDLPPSYVQCDVSLSCVWCDVSLSIYSVIVPPNYVWCSNKSNRVSLSSHLCDLKLSLVDMCIRYTYNWHRGYHKLSWDVKDVIVHWWIWVIGDDTDCEIRHKVSSKSNRHRRCRGWAFKTTQ